jgi:hypothetical protein
MSTLLALRRSEPRALLFLESATLAASGDGDPLETWALELGLSPVSGAIESLAPPRAETLTLDRRRGGFGLRHRLGTDFVSARRLERWGWWRAAGGEAIVVVARGLGLKRAEPSIEEALELRPSWAAVVTLEERRWNPWARVRHSAA